jgi:subfamily B ATP-binding cassette protein MsbA
VKEYRRILRYLRPYIWPRGVLAVVFMLVFSGLESGIPFLIKYAFDEVFANQSVDALNWVVLSIAIVSLARGFLGMGAVYWSDWIGQRVVTDIRQELIAHLQTMDLEYFNRRRAGQVVQRVTGDVVLIRGTVSDALKSLFKDTTSLIGLTVVALYLDWMLALLGAMAIPVAAIPIRKLSKALRQNSKIHQQAAGRLNSMLHENVQGNRVVKLFGREAHETERFRRFTEYIFGIFMHSVYIRALPVTEVLAGVFGAGVLWYGGTSIATGARTPGDLMAFMAALLLLYEPFKRLVRTNYTIQQGLAGADRVFEVLDLQPKVLDAPNAVELETVRDGIAIEDVTFAYEPGNPVLHHIDLRIPAGSVVALVGASGGGKSTLSDLIPRLYDVTAGRIAVDGVDVREYTLQSLRRHIAVVTQFTFLFNDTVRANIAYGDLQRSVDEIEQAARDANAHEFITALPKGYDTPIGDLGVRLSGGQRQRIAIARALLRNAPILILDEATSALDTESEGLVQEALERLMVNRTTLVVAHRLSTVRRADRIVVLVGGRIVEHGTHDELLARGRDYRKLYDLQFGEGEWQASQERSQERSTDRPTDEPGDEPARVRSAAGD